MPLYTPSHPHLISCVFTFNLWKREVSPSFARIINTARVVYLHKHVVVVFVFFFIVIVIIIIFLLQFTTWRNQGNGFYHHCPETLFILSFPVHLVFSSYTSFCKNVLYNILHFFSFFLLNVLSYLWFRFFLVLYLVKSMLFLEIPFIMNFKIRVFCIFTGAGRQTRISELS